MNAIPSAVRQQADRAEQLHKEVYGQTAETPATEPAAPAAPPGDPDPSATTVANPEPAAPPPSVAPTPAAPDPALAELRVQLQAERDRRAMAESRAQLLENTLQQHQQQAQPSAPQPPGVEIPETQLAEYGQEFFDVVAAHVTRVLGSRLDALEQRLAGVQSTTQTIATRTQLSDRERLLQSLDAQVPGWREQNTDAGFNAWLDQADPFSGAIRFEMLQKAFEANDAARVAAFFNGYRKELGVVTQPATPPQPTSPVAAPAAPPPSGVSLASLAAPGRGLATPGAAAPSDQPSFTRAQVAQFYREKSSGKWSGREAEALRLEAQIVAAGAQGRIT